VCREMKLSVSKNERLIWYLSELYHIRHIGTEEQSSIQLEVGGTWGISQIEFYLNYWPSALSERNFNLYIRDYKK
jgi:hypothetical protein